MRLDAASPQGHVGAPSRIRSRLSLLFVPGFAAVSGSSEALGASRGVSRACRGVADQAEGDDGAWSDVAASRSAVQLDRGRLNPKGCPHLALMRPFLRWVSRDPGPAFPTELPGVVARLRTLTLSRPTRHDLMLLGWKMPTGYRSVISESYKAARGDESGSPA